MFGLLAVNESCKTMYSFTSNSCDCVTQCELIFMMMIGI